MNRAEKRRQKKLEKKAAIRGKAAHAHSTSTGHRRNSSGQKSIDLGLQHHAAGDLIKAQEIYRSILQSEPNHAAALNLLGFVAHQLGDNISAIDLIERSIAQEPDEPGAHFNLGNAYRELGRLDDAAKSFQKTLSLSPKHPDAHFNLGNALMGLGCYQEAEVAYGNALALKPGDFEAHNNLGNALQKIGRMHEALAQYQKALLINRSYIDALFNLGNMLQALGRLDDALERYQEILGLKPDHLESYHQLGGVYHKQGKLNEAASILQKALALNHKSAETHSHLGTVFKDQGFVDAAIEEYNTALSLDAGQDGWRIRKALTLPVIVTSRGDIENTRSRLERSVHQLQKTNLSVKEPVAHIGTTNFYLAYHGEDNKRLQRNIAQLHLSACPDLAFVAARCRDQHRQQRSRIRVGVLSAYLHNHTIGKLFKGILARLSKEHFELITFRLSGQADEITAEIDHASEKVVRLDRDLRRDRETISDEQLDILFYPDIGMDAYGYFLAFARLAPVQVTCWGHPDTTGIPNIDYFLSSKLIENENASSFYSEHLIQLSLLPTYYAPPTRPETLFTRSQIELPETGHLYVCPQNLFKLHPDFDPIIAEILRRDANGYLILIDDGRGGSWRDLLMKRISVMYPDVTKRIQFIPKLPMDQFLSLLVLADALLDVPTFSGGNTSLEAFAMAAPIVTWPGSFMRAKVTAGCYQQMGLNELIVSNADDYVEAAIKLASEPQFKGRIQADIRDNAHKLYKREEVIKEIESFFVDAHAASINGTRLGT